MLARSKARAVLSSGGAHVLSTCIFDGFMLWDVSFVMRLLAVMASHMGRSPPPFGSSVIHVRVALLLRVCARRHAECSLLIVHVRAQRPVTSVVSSWAGRLLGRRAGWLSAHA